MYKNPVSTTIRILQSRTSLRPCATSPCSETRAQRTPGAPGTVADSSSHSYTGPSHACEDTVHSTSPQPALYAQKKCGRVLEIRGARRPRDSPTPRNCATHADNEGIDKARRDNDDVCAKPAEHAMHPEQMNFGPELVHEMELMQEVQERTSWRSP